MSATPIEPHDVRDVSALAALVAQRAGKSFAWGTRDCALWAFDAVRAVTGRDCAHDLRGRWRSALQAARVLRSEGGWAELARRRFGDEVAPPDTRDGDVALLRADVCTEDMADVGALAVRWGDSLLAQGNAGLVAIPVSMALRAWRAS